MLRIFATLAALAQATASLPPPYPRPGATKILDNDRVQVWNIAWLKGQPSPLHRHIYDLVGVYYEPGDRLIISPEGSKRPVSTKAWDIAFQRVGVTHIEEGTSDAPLRAVFVEMKQTGAFGTDDAGNGAPAFHGVGATQKLDNDCVTVWEFTQTPAPTSHRHTHDAVIVSFEGSTPRASYVTRGTTHDNDAAGHVFVFELK